ncbi:hypothetical protein K6U26_12605, partial [Vibrio parahaemolyticus]|uniref:hypothetical protein n=1 Tax=Vibrio parahaemolyticus TaxID=670 RepID=UPI001EEA4F0A
AIFKASVERLGLFCICSSELKISLHTVIIPSGKLTGEVYPVCRCDFGDSFGAIQKPIGCFADFGDDVVVIRKRKIGWLNGVASTNPILVRSGLALENRAKV